MWKIKVLQNVNSKNITVPTPVVVKSASTCLELFWSKCLPWEHASERWGVWGSQPSPSSASAPGLSCCSPPPLDQLDRSSLREEKKFRGERGCEGYFYLSYHSPPLQAPGWLATINHNQRNVFYFSERES